MGSFCSNKELIELRKRGFWVAPGESEEHFLARVERCGSPAHSGEIPEWESASDRTEELFGFRPDWIETRLARQGPLFAGGAEVGDIPVVEVAPRGWTSRRDVLAHEWLHVARMEFDEPAFEEIIAFESSASWWRRRFSPIVQSTREVISIALVSFATPFIALMNGPHPLLPLGLLYLFLGARLFYRQRLWRRTCRHLPLSLAAQLTDREIRAFARMKREEVLSYIQEGAERSLRLSQIRSALGCCAET